MMWGALLAVLSHWRRHPWQLVTVIAGLSMATALWSGVQAINAEARAAYDEAAIVSQLSALPTIQRDTDERLEISDFATLRRDGWPVTPVLRGRLVLSGPQVDLVGIDPFTHPFGAYLLESVIEISDDPGQSNVWAGLIAPPRTAARLAGVEGLPPIVENSRLPPGQVIGDIGVVATILGQPTGISHLAVTGHAPGPLPQGYILQPAPEIADVRGLTDSFHLNLAAFGALAFVVGLFILHGGIGLAVEQRRSTFRTMRAVGVPLSTLLGALSVELLVISTFAGGLGILAGYAIAAALLPNVSATLAGLYGAPAPGSLELRSVWVLAGLALAVLGAATAGGDALRRIARMPILAPAMPRSWARQASGVSRNQAIVGAALIAGGVLVGLTLDGLPSAFILMGGVLLGSALAAPYVLDRILSAFGTSKRRAFRQWFWADSRMQLPGLSLALMALLLAMAANIGVNTMVTSFRQAFTGFLDQRLVSDLYVRVEDAETAGRLASYLEERGHALLPIWHVDAAVDGWGYEIYGVADHPVYQDNWPMTAQSADSWAQLRAGRGALVSEQMARRLGWSLGDAIDLPGVGAVPVAGIYADYGNTAGQVVVDQALFEIAYPDADRLRFGVMADPDDIAGLKVELGRELGLNPAAFTDVATLREFSLSIFERTFAVTAALNVLTLGVAGFAMLTSLLTLSAVRLPQLAPVWSVGTGRGFLARIELLRALMLTLLIYLLSLPLGLALAWILLKRVNAAAFGWRLPMDIFPVQWLVLLGVAMAAAVLSAAIPALKLARTSPARLTQVFSRER